MILILMEISLVNNYIWLVEDGPNIESEYEYFYDDIYSFQTYEEADTARPRINKIVYDPKCNHKDKKIKTGQQFQDGFECKQALTNWAT